MVISEINISGDIADDDAFLSPASNKEISSKFTDKKYSTDSSEDFRTTSTFGFTDSGVDTEDACFPFITICKEEEELCTIPSPRTSPSNSLSAADLSTVKIPTTITRPGNPHLYERNLLKKHLTVPEISLGYTSDDTCRTAADETRRKLSNDSDKKCGANGYHSESEHKGSLKIRKSSGSKSKNKGESEPFVASLAVKKFSRGIRSPMFLRKNNSFKQTDSAVSSSNEATIERVEKRKKRKLSLGRRKKSQQSFYVEKNKEIQEEAQSDNERATATKPERLSRKFRRRKQSSKSQSEDLPDKSEQNKSKIVLLYSGNATKTSKSPLVSRKNRLETLKKSSSFDYSYASENEDYSSALSDIENTIQISPRKQKKPSLSMRIWKSINTLFSADNQPNNDNFNAIPPVNRKQFKRNGTLYGSMPGDLQKLYRQNELKKSIEDRKAKDDLSLLKKGEETFTLKAVTGRRNPKKDSEKMLERRKKRRSKSADDLLDHNFTKKLSPDWFEQNNKSYSATCGAENVNQQETKSNFKIVLSYEPTQPKADKDAPITSDKINSDENENPNKSELSFDSVTEENLQSTNLHRKKYMQIYMRDLKCTLQRDLNAFLKDKRFQADRVNEWCCSLSDSIKERVIQITEDNFKVVVQVFIGALFDDGIHAAMQSTTGAANNDGFFTVSFNGQDLFAVASIFTFEI